MQAECHRTSVMDSHLQRPVAQLPQQHLVHSSFQSNWYLSFIFQTIEHLRKNVYQTLLVHLRVTKILLFPNIGTGGPLNASVVGGKSSRELE